MTAPKTDYRALRAMYVEGIQDEHGNVTWPSLRELADHVGISPSSVRERSSREGWPDERALYRRRIDQERQSRRIEEIATIGADLDLHAVRAARNGLTITTERLTELGRIAELRATAMQADPKLHPDHLPGRPVDSLEMDRLARTATEWYLLGIKAIGDTNAVRIEIEQPEPLDTSARDARALGILAIMHDHGLLPNEISEVIDVSAGRLSLVAGDSPSEDRTGDDPAEQRVHPVDVDDGAQP